MSKLDTPALRVVLGDASSGAAISNERRFEILDKLLSNGHSVTCPGGEVAPHDDSDLLVLRESGGNESTGATEGEARIHFRDISKADADAVLGIVDETRQQTSTYAPGEWKPWFPVIDYDRCTNCMQCLSFCLFDVYGVDDEQVIEVRNNDKCKTNCPACSRVCPDVAILFPKYGSGPINGDEVNKEDLEREKMKTDISALLGGDIYSMLRTRHEKAASRFAKERDESRALKERVKCLKKLGEAFDIPEEVLMALPSLDEIKEKAARSFEETRNENDG